MKNYYRIFVVTVILILALASIAAAPAAKGKLSFTGSWKGRDTVDGSTIKLSITKLGAVDYFDKVFAACAGGAVRGAGFSFKTGNTLYASLKMKCVDTGVIVDNNYLINFTILNSQTLMDSNSNTYTLEKQPCRK